MAKVKRLTLQELAKLDKKFDERKKVYLLGKYEEYIDVHFRKTLIQSLIANYLEILMDLRKREDITTDTIMKSASLINALIVKYFSSIELPDIKNVEQLITVSECLINLGIMDELFGDNGFPKDQIDLLSEEMNKSAKRLGEQFGEMAINAALNETGEQDAEPVQQPE